MNDKIRWLRISYWVGAIGDVYLAFRWWFQGSIEPELDAGYSQGMKYVAVLALAWGILLIWADRKPQERKGILLITIFPVVSGLIVSNQLAYNADFEGNNVLLRSFLMGALIILMAFSFWNANRAETPAPSVSRDDGVMRAGLQETG